MAAARPIKVGTTLAVVVGREYKRPYFFRVIHETPRVWWITALKYKMAPVPEANHIYRYFPIDNAIGVDDLSDLKRIVKCDMASGTAVIVSIHGVSYRLKVYSDDNPVYICRYPDRIYD